MGKGVRLIPSALIREEFPVGVWNRNMGNLSGYEIVETTPVIESCNGKGTL